MSDDKSALSGVATDVTLPQLRATPSCLPEGQAPTEFAYAAGDQVGERYRIVRRLGEGGMGEVYEAEDLLLRERVALKTLRPAVTHDELTILRFKREIQLARKVTHRNVCRLFDVGLDRPKGRDAAYITMELLEGETLSARLHRAGRMSTAEALPIAEQLSAALVAAHSAGVIHRDLKCSNVILVEAPPRAVVTDMGMARAATTDGDQITGDAVVGTPAYMAPEQVEGGRRITAACDVYALGVVLFEMVTGVLPFVAETPLATAVMRLRVPPPSPRSIVPDLDPRWELAILSCLARDPEARPRDAESVLRLLRPASTKTVRRRIVRVAVAATFLALALFAGWLWRNAASEAWVHQTATPEIERLLADDDYASAAALAREALVVSPGNAELEKLWTQATLEVSIDSTPPGADVLYRPYRSAPESWTHLGKTPLSGARIPRDFYVWQVANSGFLPAWRIAPSWLLFSRRPVKLTFHLVPEKSAPPGMVGVEAVSKLVFDPVSLPPDPDSAAPIDSAVPLDDFFIDRHEVTNAEYKRFVDAGGYVRPELWKQPFVRDGQPVSWEQAKAAFRDTTGRPGPSTWDLGTFPAGHDNHPVAGVSWYEAAAYALFAGKSLPTVHHWRRAAQQPAGMLVVPGSNLDAGGTVPVAGAGALSGFGTYDMAGNVKEWCLNESEGGRRYVLGGGFGEPSYMFIDLDAQTPWLRAANVGFRCAVLSTPPAAEALRPIAAAPLREPHADQTASEEVFHAYQRLFAYDRTDLHARIESTEETEVWRRERVSFDAAYGGERVIAFLYLPKAGRPPFQTVVLFPGSDALFVDKFELSRYYGDFVPKSGRALLAPMFKSTYERRDPLVSDIGELHTIFWRDHVVAWSKDLGRSLDYLESREEIDRERLAYLGFSWGAGVAPVMLAVEHRFKTAVLGGGGLWLEKTLPEVDPVNFVGRVHIPVLMVNGRYDHVYALETSQKWLFELLGTPVEWKKHVVYDSGHAPPRREFIRDSLEWLDATLGPVRR